ncbi:OLC1v1037937C1 [Oldenlandia corymbosa var. corymbosa]|uniref:Beta-galactosidase n=1 Tax=Oldenlandia corymbosa var. corymbosa TaxID=529605 RepID=A0AAV1D0U6_OLDCO|nr:OLC1v1037937C1 [Oldenlandia corymbosa var. corymbosa]
MASHSILTLFALIFVFKFSFVLATDVSYDGRAITIDSQRRILLSGSIHYPRSTAEMWPDLIKKAKEGGLDAIETYIFWNAHEPVRRQYDFSGNLDFIRFLKTVQNEGLYAVLRIGPYVCAEWNYGGFPVWLHNMPGIELRTANDVFMNEMQNFTSLIVDMAKQENLFASQGGPIIIAQIENEYGNVMSQYGAAGKAYVDWCANMANSLDIGVPWIMCQQPDPPSSVIGTCNGWYCHEWEQTNPNAPKMWTENWTGWFKSWGGSDPYRTAEDVAYAVARFFQTGGSFQNYYMYHGGTNFGRVAGGPYITTTYDYDAPLDEFGNLNQPKYGHLKQLHDMLHLLEEALTYGNVTNMPMDNSASATIFSLNGTSACFLVNENTTADNTITIQGNQFVVPAWSVSILPDCQTEAYNTAKVTTQTSIMVKRSNGAESEPASLVWSWMPEDIHDTVVEQKGQRFASQLIDQKAINDASDYLWYMTSLNLDKNDPIWTKNMSLRVNGTGQIMHAFVNGEYLGSDWAMYGTFQKSFEKNVNLNPGSNKITLLSATVGLQNYGPYFDLVADGLPGPVEIVGRNGDETIIKDLSAHTWSYKIGMNGLEKNFYSSENSPPTWQTQNLPMNRNMTWYKTTFKAPLGNDPVVVDMLGLGKGLAWVNGNSIGRYWPSYLAVNDGSCSTEACDYRGKYSNSKCVSGCGEPTQRWYHVPRSFLKDGANELVLFEEFGGNPSLVNFQTVVVGSVCGSVAENNTLELSCHGRPISAIKYAHFGNSQGNCGSFRKGTCGATTDSLSAIQNSCVGKESCSVIASGNVFGATNCTDVPNKLVVEALC